MENKILDRKILVENLKGTMIQNITDKNIIDEVKTDMLKLNVSHGTVQDIFNQRITTEQLSEDVLYYLSKSMCGAIVKKKRRLEEDGKEGESDKYKPNLIEPSKYFTDNEIEEIKLLKITKLSNEAKKLPYTIKNVIEVSRDHKVVFMRARELVELYNQGLIRYRLETQRQPTIKKDKDGELIKVPTINNASIEEIKNEMKKGTFITNYITLNSIKPDSFHYNEITGELEVLEILDIADGNHRSMAMVMAIAESESGDIDYTTGINITNWDTNKILRFIEQEDKKNKMSVRFVKTLNKDKKSNIVVEQMNEDVRSDLYGKIVTDIKFIQENKALTLTDIMQEGIDRYFKLNSMLDVENVKDYLTKGYRYIIGTYQDIFIEKLKENKDITYMAHENMFVVYMYILKEIKNEDNFQEKLGNILDRIDFTVKNPIWEEIGMLKQSLSKKTMKKMEKYIGQFIV